MNWGTVPAANIAAIAVSCILCTGLPVILLIIFKKKNGWLPAALFEETGRWTAFRFFLKNHLTAETALMYGAGHGGAESILIVGITYISNIVTSIMINSGTFENTMSTLDNNLKQTAYEQLSPLWTSSAGTFLMAGVERIFSYFKMRC